MKVTIKKGIPCGTVTAPPSKSMAHRLLICAALANGTSTISNVAISDDIKATIGALKSLGADIQINGSAVTVTGPLNNQNPDTINCNESGSTLRFMIPLCLLKGTDIRLCGTKRLFSRSLAVFETLCRERGFAFVQDSAGVTVNGRLESGVYRVRGDISSQFISGLMFALPNLNGDSVIEIENTLESAPYIDLTTQALSQFNVKTLRENNKIYISHSTFTPCNESVEGDCSNAAFFDALNLMGGSVKVLGLDPNTLQGDYIYKDYFNEIKNGCPTLDISDCPDLAPILMAAGAASNGVTLVGTRRLKIKESDRGAAMASELKKMSVDVKISENTITVGHGIQPPADTIYGHNDHRIVMAMACLMTKTGGTIDGAGAVCKSMPDFFEKLRTLGVEVIDET